QMLDMKNKLKSMPKIYSYTFLPQTFCSIWALKLNARLRGWQRSTTKLKHNNRNHRGSMGLETPRVDSPS
ncbi:hypothetical protein, partial [Vibrio cholerae]|uniref:hypothetical protein n=1 Tax=Vibrio cholerae TaxID=666 RepID=UPI00307FE4F3